MFFNSSTAFAYAASGRFNESSVQAYDSYVSDRLNQYVGRSGWLGETVAKAQEYHRRYIDSGMWDYANYIRSTTGVYVSRYEIGYLGTVEAQRRAEGLMQYVIQANPTVRDLIINEQISGYYEIENLFTWKRELDQYYNKLMDGVALTKEDEMVIVNFLTSRDSHTRYSFREKTDAQRTWRMSNRMIEHGIDPTSVGNVITAEEVETRRKQKAEKEENKDD